MDIVTISRFLLRIAETHGKSKNHTANLADPTSVTTRTLPIAMEIGFDVPEDPMEMPAPEILEVKIVSSWFDEVRIKSLGGNPPSVDIEFCFEPACQDHKAKIHRPRINSYLGMHLDNLATDEELIANILERLVFEGDWGVSEFNEPIEDYAPIF